MFDFVECYDMFNVDEEKCEDGIVYRVLFKDRELTKPGWTNWDETIRFHSKESAEWEADRWIRRNYDTDGRIIRALKEKHIAIFEREILALPEGSDPSSTT